nr:capsular polysaccharide synthesis protein [Limosilactobacillus mucosae]
MGNSFKKFEINNQRKILRTLDLLSIPTRKLYLNYYDKLLHELDNVFKSTEISYKDVKLKDNYFLKKVWVMWWQGYDKAPELIKSNIQRLRGIFGNNSVIVIDQNNYKKYTNISSELVDKLLQNKITFTFWSDIVRYNLLMNNGGMWIDSTVVMSKMLKNHIDEFFRNDFFSLCNVKEDYKFISLGKWTGWCIGGKRGFGLFKFVNCFFETYYDYYDEQIDYFLVDDAVTYYYLHNDEFRKIVKEESSKWEPYLFINNLTNTKTTELFSKFNTNKEYSIQKFTYKYRLDESIPKEALIYKLIDTNCSD